MSSAPNPQPLHYSTTGVICERSKIAQSIPKLWFKASEPKGAKFFGPLCILTLNLLFYFFLRNYWPSCGVATAKFNLVNCNHRKFASNSSFECQIKAHLVFFTKLSPNCPARVYNFFLCFKLKAFHRTEISAWHTHLLSVEIEFQFKCFSTERFQVIYLF